MSELNVYDLIADRICVISHPPDVYDRGFTEGGSAVEGGVRVEECILLWWSLYIGRICEEEKRRRRVLISIVTVAECVPLWGELERAAAGISNQWTGMDRSLYIVTSRVASAVQSSLSYLLRPQYAICSYRGKCRLSKMSSILQAT